MPNLYALLVGINNYTTVTPLNGCINDIEAVEEWLRHTYLRKKNLLHIKRLTDNETDELLQPTRQNIISAFDHFAAAKDDDTCLFYFCGHGANLEAPPEFTFRGSELQALVCLDFYGNDLKVPVRGVVTDKELSYLIWNATRDKPSVYFVAITDCCHSGTMTRGIEEFNGLTTVRSLPAGFISPPLGEFYGFDAGQPAGYELTGNNCTVKTGRHLHFAAAQNDQVAREVNLPGGVARGAFTFAMLNLLNDEMGLFSYQQLEDGISAKIKNYFFNGQGPIQAPSISLSYNMPSFVKDYVFLQNKNINQQRTYLVYYSKQYGWCMKAGQLQNLSIGDEVEVDTDDDEPKRFIVNALYGDFAVIAQAAELEPLSQVFRGTVIGQLKKTCKFYFGDDVPPQAKQQIWAAQYGGNKVAYNNVELLDSASYRHGVDYALAITNGNIMLTGPGQQLELAQTTNPSPETVSALLETLNTVSNCDLLLHFDNEGINFAKPYQLNLQCTTGLDDDGQHVFAPGMTDGSLNAVNYYADGQITPQFKLDIKNLGTEPLCVSFAYLGADHSIETESFYPIDLQPGDPAQFLYYENKESNAINLMNDGTEVITEYLKVCIAAFPNGIPLGSLYQAGAGTRGIGASQKMLPPPGTYWKTETIAFNISPANP